MWNVGRLFALSVFLAASVLGTTVRGQQDETGFFPGPNGFPMGQEGGFGAFLTSLLRGSSLGLNAPGDQWMLVNLPAVQQELKLTDAQKLKLKELKEEQSRSEREDGPATADAPESAPAREAGPAVRNPAVDRRSATGSTRRGRGQGQGRNPNQGSNSPPSRPNDNPGNAPDPSRGGFGLGPGGVVPGGFDPSNGFNPLALMTRLGSRLQKTEAEMLRILEPNQRERLEEIGLQHVGVKAVARPEIGRKLNLTNAQTGQIEAIAHQLQAGQLEMMEQHLGEFLQRMGPLSPAQVDPRFIQEAARQAGQANQGLVKRAETAIARVLKPAQKDALQKLQGEPFDLKAALAGKPLRPKPGEGDRAEAIGYEAGTKTKTSDVARAGAPAAEAPRAEAPRPAHRLKVPRAKDAGKRPSAARQP